MPLAPPHLLYLHDDGAELWRRRGRRLIRIATLVATDDFSRRLGQLLQRARVRRVGLLLALPGLSLQWETAPATVSRLDRRKLALRRLEFLQPGALLRGVLFDGQRAQLAAVRLSPLLQSVLAGIVRAPVVLAWCVHAGLEASALLPVTRMPQPGLLVLQLGQQGGLLLAHEGRQIVAVRFLPAERLAPTLLAAELEATLAYMLRHGWTAANAPSVRLYGIPPLDPALSPLLARQQVLSNADAKAELLAQLFRHGQPHFNLDRPRLLRRRRLQGGNILLQRLAISALVLSLGGAGGTVLLTRALALRSEQVRQLAAPLPPAEAMPGRTQLETVSRQAQAQQSLPALLGLAPRAFTYKATAAGQISLQITSPSPMDLPGWQLVPAKMRQASGVLGQTDNQDIALPRDYRFTGAPQ